MFRMGGMDWDGCAGWNFGDGWDWDVGMVGMVWIGWDGVGWGWLG